MKHLVADDLLHGLHFGRGRLQQQFVVNLQHDRRLGCCRPQPSIHSQHGQLDEVSGGALHDRVNRRPLGEREREAASGTSPSGAIADAADRSPPTEHRRHAAVTTAAIEHVVHEGQRPGERLEVGGDEGGGVGLWDAQRLGEPKTALSIEDAEIHRLRGSPQRGGHRRRLDAKHPRCRAGVDVLARVKGTPHRLVA